MIILVIFIFLYCESNLSYSFLSLTLISCPKLSNRNPPKVNWIKYAKRQQKNIHHTSFIYNRKSRQENMPPMRYNNEIFLGTIILFIL